jgi:hypothetical protein
MTTKLSIFRRAGVIAGLGTGASLLVVGLASGGPAQASSAAPPCVSTLTPTIGAFQEGNTVLFGEVAAAPGLVSGTVLGPLAQVPGITETSSTVYAAFPELNSVANQISSQGSQGLTVFGQSIGPLASANPALDALVALGSGGLGSGATTFGTSIAPFNGTLAQLSQTIAFFSSSSCK